MISSRGSSKSCQVCIYTRKHYLYYRITLQILQETAQEYTARSEGEELTAEGTTCLPTKTYHSDSNKKVLILNNYTRTVKNN